MNKTPSLNNMISINDYYPKNGQVMVAAEPKKYAFTGQAIINILKQEEFLKKQREDNI